MKRSLQQKVSLACALVLLSGTLTACGAPSAGPGGAGGNMPAAAAENAVVRLSMAYPQRQTIAISSEIIGTVKPKNQSDVLPKASGEVLAVHFQVGDRVSAGQVLVTLDSDSLVSARINVDNAQIQLETAQKNLERTQVLFDSGAESQQSLEQAQQSAATARLQLESAQDNYNTLEKNVNITAPLSGVIESRSVEVHDNISPQTVICTIAQKDTMQVVFQVSERIKNTLNTGDAITLTKNGTDYNGTITEIADKTSDNSGLFEVKADISQGSELSSGTKVALRLITDRAENVLTIPVDAVYYDDGKPYVFINNNGTAELRYIETGLYDDQLMQVISGLDDTTEVITSWSSKLTNGTAVTKAEQEGEV